MADGDSEADAAAQEAETSIERGRHLFAQECRFVAGAATTDILPPPDLPEVAFAGRSNVGKSSLINALTGRNTLARVSHTPGRTRQINFFSLGDRLTLVDMPGLGYARAPKGEISRWTRLAGDYLRGRVNLRRLVLLVDARHGLKEIDRALMERLDDAAVSYSVALTKADKVEERALASLLEALRRELRQHPAAIDEIAVTSARTGAGVPELRAALAALAAPPHFR